MEWDEIYSQISNFKIDDDFPRFIFFNPSILVYYFVKYEYNDLKFVDPVLRRFSPVIYRWQRALWKICCSSRVEFRAVCPCFRRKPVQNFVPSFASLANWNFDGSDRILLINWKIENKVVSSPFPDFFYCRFLRETNFVSFSDEAGEIGSFWNLFGFVRNEIENWKLEYGLLQKLKSIYFRN